MNILNKLKSLSVSYRIYLQWIPSHVNIQGNEIADALAKAGADDASVPSAPTWSCSLELKAGINFLADSTGASLVSGFSTRWLSIN
ncbi:hypothetical protein AVEN_165760-1 [Araneus ventricosus]|uniref:RNase H type-1 domain-containing protein n=1 Tax=Araneus ventricosus TaxID=182803 RepID=A0A4Y2PWI8_ARAVE|nr:hypothetical protein AVEN_165760-1 [Araneus ventricosus]